MAGNLIWAKRKEELVERLPKLNSDANSQAEIDLREYIKKLAEFFGKLEDKRKAKISNRVQARIQAAIDLTAALEALDPSSPNFELDRQDLVQMSQVDHGTNNDGSEEECLEIVGKEYKIKINSELGYQPVYLITSLLEQASIDLSHITVRSSEQSKGLSNREDLAKLIGHRCPFPMYSTEQCTVSIGKRLINPYLHDRFSIRILPYSKEVLVGVPRSIYAKTVGEDYEASTDFMMIPHEVGHHVFRHGRTNNGENLKRHLINEIEQSAPNWAMRWLEEIFADAYGCFVAGGLSIVGFQNMLIGSPPSRVFVSSQTHPLAALRPLIQARILKRLWTNNKGTVNARVEEETEFLDKAWHNEAEELWGIQRLKNHIFSVDGIPMQGSFVLRNLEPIEIAVCDELKNLFGDPEIFSEPISKGYQIGRTELKVIGGPKAAAAVQQQPLNQATGESFKDPDFEWLTVELEVLSKHREDESITIDELADIVLFSGWSDEGPKVGPGGG